ncbi:MAG: 4Fe-4S dicluster domain-containing protein [Proteobacteria bacterium]|jgi:heterodisulfide reductase subunit C|nr:4Fe-4S dicluster domain-containing protein [Pseudomonadota bacterium]
MKVELSIEKVRSEFIEKIEEISGQNLFSCYQCGKCSAGCPFSFAMDLLPSHIIRMVQLGLQEDIGNSKTMWLCSSCLTCGVRCPRGVDVPRIMEALRVLVTRDKINYVEPSSLTPEQLEELPQIALISNFRKFTG